METLAYAVVLIALLTLQGFVLQTAVALSGDPAPRYGRSLLTAWIAGVSTLVGVGLWKVTLGFVIGLFSPLLSTAIAIGLGVVITAIAVRFRLGLRGAHSLFVAMLYNAMAAGVSAAVWWLFHALV